MKQIVVRAIVSIYQADTSLSPSLDEPPICGYSSEKPHDEKSKDESVTYIEERTDDEIVEYAHTAGFAHIARHLNVDLK